MDRCDECAFVFADVPAREVPRLLRGLGARYAAVLGEVRDVRRRPAPEVWSPLEYTCHVRDVLRVQGERLALALVIEEPDFTPMGRDERAVADAYNAQDPPAVLAELAVAAEDVAAAFAGLGPAELARTGLYFWPQPQVRTLLWLGRQTVHEGEHHLLDVRRAARAQAAAQG